MPERAASAAQRRPIYNAKRVDRRRALEEPANDNSLRVQRNDREYTDYTPVNDDAPGTYPTTSERYRAAAARRSRRPSNYEALQSGATPESPETVYDPETGRYIYVGAAAATATPGGSRRPPPRRLPAGQVTTSTSSSASISATDRAATRGLGLILQAPVWFYYTAFQLPFATLLIIFFGATGAYETVAGEDTWVGAIIGGIGGVSEAVLGVDVFGALDPTPIYMGIQGILLGFHAFVITLLLLIYTIVGRGKIKPIGLGSQQANLLKITVFIGAITSCLPLFSYLPLIPLWTWVVWRFPR